MLRRLARLTNSVQGTPGALAIALHAGPDGTPMAAARSGDQGVARVDDAARALSVLCDLWNETRLPVTHAWARGLLEFVLSMQDQDGRFVNVIIDWSGARDRRHPMSAAGGSFWQARAIRALAKARLTFEDPRIDDALARGMARIREVDAPADVRAVHLLAAIELLRAGRMPELRRALEGWCGEIVACARDGVLFDNPDESAPHLSGHLQEGALAEAGAYLGRADLLEVAGRSARAYLAPIIYSAFDLPTVRPDGVAAAVFDVERLAALTGDPAFTPLVPRARGWFDARNSSGRPVYDRDFGRVHDGIDARALNVNSGAESNIAGAEALFPDLGRIATTYLVEIEKRIALLTLNRPLATV